MGTVNVLESIRCVIGEILQNSIHDSSMHIQRSPLTAPFSHVVCDIEARPHIFLAVLE